MTEVIVIPAYTKYIFAERPEIVYPIVMTLSDGTVDHLLIEMDLVVGCEKTGQFLLIPVQ